MKKTFLMSAVLAIAGVGLMAGSALADPVDFAMGGGSRIDPSLNGDIITIAEITGNVELEEFTLDYVGDFYSFDFAWMGSVSLQNGAVQPITAWLDFDIPADIDVDVPGTVFGETFFQGTYEQGQVTWNDPVSVVLGNGVSFDVELSDTVFDTFRPIDKVELEFAWGKIDATVTLTSEASGPTPTPEPATMLLFGTGLAGLAGVARRKKAQKK